jgi:hypothetical protein
MPQYLIGVDEQTIQKKNEWTHLIYDLVDDNSSLLEYDYELKDAKYLYASQVIPVQCWIANKQGFETRA